MDAQEIVVLRRWKVEPKTIIALWPLSTADGSEYLIMKEEDILAIAG